MSDSPHKDLILDTIDRLRKRKARPDLERICHMVLRRYGLGAGDTERLVGKLVDDEIVFKVEYKGNVSYRNAAKWRRSRIGGVVMNSSQASENLRSAIEALTGNNDNNNNSKNGGGESRRGASSGDIQKWLAVNYKEMARINLHVALQREVDASRVGRLADGSYVTRELVAPRKAAPKEKSADTATGGGRPKSKVGSRQQQAKNSSNTSSCKRGRPTSKRKKFKKQLGPDFEGETVPTKMGVDKCDFCLQTAENNKIGEQEELLFCNDCHAKAHPSCMQYSDELAKRARRSPWQCFDCKVCNICEDSGDGDSMLFCDACDKGFHMDCHNPPLSEKPTGKWLCGWCIYETREQQNYDDVTMSPASESANELSEQQNTDTGGASCLPTPCDSPVLSDSWGKENELNFNKIKSNMEILLPPSKRMKYSDSHSAAADWSVDDVADFIQSAGFLTEAEAFKEQEIDGKSLLLMKRNDVLTGLAIKLGPALKIYNHVRRLQMEGGS